MLLVNEGKEAGDTFLPGPAENLLRVCFKDKRWWTKTNRSASSEFLDRQSGSYRSLSPTVKVRTFKQLGGHTEAAFSYGDHATFAQEVLPYQSIESIEVGTWSTIELVELAGPCWMASDGRIETCGEYDHLRSKQYSGRTTNRMFGRAREPPSIHGGSHR